MKYLILLIFTLSIFIVCNAQSNKFTFSYENFDKEILNYQPKKDKTSEKSYANGVFILGEVKKRVTKKNSLDIVDYFNLLAVFLDLNESKKNIKTVFEKIKNAEGKCDYILSYEKHVEQSSKYDIIREEYNNELKKCKSIIEKVFDISEYSKANNLDFSLISKISKIYLKDQKYRGNLNDKNKSKQILLDKQNQKEINSLFKMYKAYIGRSLVGTEFETVMWSVIQHSNVKMMEEYLPILHKAFKEKELKEQAFKTLIDRYYGLKYGYQIYGSQSGFGFELDDKKKRREIELKYGIE